MQPKFWIQFFCFLTELEMKDCIALFIRIHRTNNVTCLQHTTFFTNTDDRLQYTEI